MRKEYKKPIVAAAMLDTEPMMNTTSAETSGVNIGKKPVGGNTPDLSIRNRGEWGNLWK